MSDEMERERERLIEQIVAAACGPAGARRRDPVARFVRAYYRLEPLDNLTQRSVDALAATARGQMQFVRRRAPAQALIRIRRPGLRATGDLAVLETCVEDKPFLVDSIRMRLRDAGAAVDWAVHPVIRIAREATGQMQAIGSGTAESLIHMEFEPLPTARAYAELERALQLTLEALAAIVGDYPAMRRQLRREIKALAHVPAQCDEAQWAEARAFLEWLDQSHFSFFGAIRERPRAGGDPRTALGLLRAPERYDCETLFAPQQELDKYEDSTRVIVITKATQRAPVHHPDYMDVISVKHFDPRGRRTHLMRFIGLFSTDAYLERPRNIPLLRRKVEYVMARARVPERSHYGKHLRDILHQLPRDELFQSSETELLRTALGILALHERQPLRLFMRRDRYGRFYSFMVYMPRERYSWPMRDRIEQALLEVCGGLGADRHIDWLRDGMVRLHFIVRTPPGTSIDASAQQIEQRLIAHTRTFADQLAAQLRQRFDTTVAERFAQAFPPSYTETASPAEAAQDVAGLLQLSTAQPLLARLSPADAGAVLKLYTTQRPLELSAVLPMLTRFGLPVAQEDTVEIHPAQGGPRWIQRFELRLPDPAALASPLRRLNFEQAFMAAWHGTIEDDGLNQLVTLAGLTARRVSLLRALCKYLLQTGLPLGLGYMERILAQHPTIARRLTALFEARFDPAADPAGRESECASLAQAAERALDEEVSSLDGDRVLRGLLDTIRACVRSNYFQPGADGGDKPWLSFKFDSARVPELPRPLPKYEIWVYAPWMEGIHLRGGAVARGGLRWSDRMQDFRTEILGLMKAQMVKNAIIVPVGAKGGFVVKSTARQTAAGGEDPAAAGLEAYRTFLRGLLDLTDNRVGGAVTPPPAVVRHDGDDPYLAVAADKGTARFSDVANAVAAEYGFWLGDAFASGGRTGYDHKQMGITARGAWESVKRHFRELGVDPDSDDVSCIGIGDMSGDVFGNGMLLSRRIRLLAAFDHRHVFIDPDPDPEASWRERKRLFELPRSSWADYDPALISAGGGVWARSAKSIPLSPQVHAWLGVDRARLTPSELIRALLGAPADLLWNGGIGTYVKAKDESDLDVGDRANDALRITAARLRCRVVGEGGNLGVTQRARIEYALGGGRINTDAIDNAAGVHTSDREVNIKIPLHRLVDEGRLGTADRDRLLASLTDTVAEAVLYANYLQAQALSLMARGAAGRLDDDIALMRLLEREGLLDRTLEFLPDDEALSERRSRGQGLTRPELAVLMAYAKISLKRAALEAGIVDDPFFVGALLDYFPPPLAARFPEALIAHPLRREIIATLLANRMVDRMGAGFAHLQADIHGLPVALFVKAHAIADRIFGAEHDLKRIEALDGTLPCARQYRLMDSPAALLARAGGWLARSHWIRRPAGAAIERFAGPAAELAMALPELLPPEQRAAYEQGIDALRKEGAPEELARRLAGTGALGAVMDIAELAERHASALPLAGAVYFLCGERFGMTWLYAAIDALATHGKWQAVARAHLHEDASRLQRRLAARVLSEAEGEPAARLDAWIERHGERVTEAERRLREIRASGESDFSTLAVAVRTLRPLLTPA